MMLAQSFPYFEVIENENGTLFAAQAFDPVKEEYITSSWFSTEDQAQKLCDDFNNEFFEDEAN